MGAGAGGGAVVTERSFDGLRFVRVGVYGVVSAA